MSENLKDILERGLAEVRAKTEEGLKDVVRAEEIDRIKTDMTARFDELQAAIAAANTVSAVDAVADASALEKSAVGRYFIDGDNAVERQRDGKAYIKADGDVAALTVSAQGGILLPPQYGDMIDGLNRKACPIRNFAKVVQGNLNFQSPIKTSQGDAANRGEFDPLHYSAAPKYDMLNHTFQEINSTEGVSVWADLNTSGLVNYTQSVIADVVSAMGEQETAYFMLGTTQNAKTSGGTLKNGLLSQTKLVAGVDEFTNVMGSLAGVETVVAGKVTPDDVINTLFTLRERYDANTSILTSREVLKEIITAKDDMGRYLLEVGNVQDGFAARVLNKGLATGDFFPTIATAGNVPVLIVGDFKQGMTIVDASGVRWVVDTVTDKRLVQYTGRRLTSSAITNHNALRALYVKASS